MQLSPSQKTFKFRMSSKVNVKPSKQRPRSSDKLKKRRDGTPEKVNTPSQDALPEEGLQPEKKPVIINDEIRALQIKAEDLDQVHEPKPPQDRKKTPAVHPIVVRKLKPASEWDKPPPKMVTVAKPAPPDAPLQPLDYTNTAGLRFDMDGQIVPHSILGSVEDYKEEALRRGDLPAELLQPGADKGSELTVKYEKKKRLSQFPKFESVEESNALKNWQKRMMERRKQQNHLSKMLDKAPERLVMNQADSYRKTQEQRYLIDRTISTVDYGKGYRIGSEFWNQRERIGDDLTGIHMTLSQTGKGYPPPIEHVGVPKSVHQEKGSDWDRPRTPFTKPWHKPPYLSQRKAQLQPVMKELDPYRPDLQSLEIVGSNQPGTLSPDISESGTLDYEEMKQEYLEREQDNLDPLASHPDVYPEPVFGPSLRFAGQTARWTGDSASFRDQAGLEARVSFEAYAGDRVTSFLEIVNDGTTCIYYTWKKVPKIDPFEMMAAKGQRFYFNTSSGVILPGDTMKFPFVFKSPNAGVFSEQWSFETTPIVCGGASLVVTLRGVALQKDKYKKQRTELEQELAHKQAEQIVSGLVEAILDGIRTPERPSSPIDFYITEMEIFSRRNPGLHYSNETVIQLKKLYDELYPEEPEEEKEEGEEEGEEKDKPEKPEWDLSVENLKEQLMCLDEDNETKQEMLQRLDSAMISLSFPPYTPRQKQMYNMGCELLSEVVDSVAGESAVLRTALGMPDREDDIPDEPKSMPGSRKASRASGRGSGTRPPSSADSMPSESKKKGQRDSKTDKDKKSPAKDAKTSGRPSAKEVNRGKVTPGVKRTTSRDKERPASGGSGTLSPILSASGDPVLEANYREKLYTHCYLLISDTVDKMAVVFEGLHSQEGGTTLPVLK